MTEYIAPYKKENQVLNLSFEFALPIIAYREQLEELKRFNMARQPFRSRTSVHANISEAQNAESKKDFSHKMKLAAKEGEETEGWLLLCKHSKSNPSADALQEKLASILKPLNKIIGTAKTAIS